MDTGVDSEVKYIPDEQNATEAAVKRAAAIVPSARQVKWNCMEFYGFVHFGLYTFDPSREGKAGLKSSIRKNSIRISGSGHLRQQA